MEQISIALTHYNRFDMLVKSVEQVIADPRVGEIVISDDKSTDGSYDKILGWASLRPKIKPFQNQKNLDCYRNKQNAVFRSSFEYVILLDSDNIIGPDYLNCIYRYIFQPDVILAPDLAAPTFDYRHLGGRTVTKSNLEEFIDERHFFTALNTCNYFVHRKSYLEVWDPGIDPHTADSLYQAYRWVSSGKRIHFVQGLTYYHRVHKESHFKLNCHKTGNLAKEIEGKLRAMA